LSHPLKRQNHFTKSLPCILIQFHQGGFTSKAQNSPAIATSQMTFSCNNWKNVGTIAVNSFAKENFCKNLPFLLLPDCGLITLTFPLEKRFGMK